MAWSNGHAPNGIELTKPLTSCIHLPCHIEIDWNAHTFSIMNFDLFQSLMGNCRSSMFASLTRTSRRHSKLKLVDWTGLGPATPRLITAWKVRPMSHCRLSVLCLLSYQPIEIGSGSGSRTQPSPGYEPSMQPMHRPAILKLLKHSHECKAFALDPRFSTRVSSKG